MVARIVFIFFQIVAGLASIAGWLFMLCSNETNRLIALILFCICLLAICISLIAGIFYYVRTNNPAPYLIDAVYAKIVYTAPTEGSYEFFKTLQNKRVFMSEFTQKLNWTGSGLKNVQSPLSYSIDHKDEPYHMHTFVVKFKRPLVFNQVTTIHLNMDLEDLHNTCEPWLGQDIKQPTHLLYFSVILKYKPEEYTKSAVITKSLIGSPSAKEMVASVPFEQKTKSYTYVLEPEMGYSYRIEWEK